MARKHITFTPKVSQARLDKEKVTSHTVRAELDGAPLGDPRSVGLQQPADFGEQEVAEGNHVLVFYVTDLDARGNAGREHRQEYTFEAIDTTPPGEAEDGDVSVEDVEDAGPAAESVTDLGPETPATSGRKGR